MALHIAFFAYLFWVVFIGLFAGRLIRNLSDYVLGGRRLSGPIAALSAGASDMSSWLLMGLPGAVYLSGLQNLYVAVGLIIGAYLNWLWIAKPLRVYTEMADDALTIPAFLDKRFGGGHRGIRAMSALSMVVYFTVYTSAGFVAGAKLLSLVFGISYLSALLFGTAMIVFYTYVGGFLAVSWTDFFQGTFMMCCMLLVPYFAGQHLQDVHVLNLALESLQGQGSHLPMLAILSSLAWGLGYFGQPHVLVRFMSVRSTDDLPIARRIGMGWMILSLLGAVWIGLIGQAFFAQPHVVLNDHELVFVQFSQVLFSPATSGILLAAIISSIMCAADSQLLASSSAVSEDFYRTFLRPQASQRELVWVGRLAVIVMSLIALFIACDPQSFVMSLVEFAWAGLACTFAPSVIACLFVRRLCARQVIFSMCAGGLTVMLWRLGGILCPSMRLLYEMIPGMIVGISALMLSHRAQDVQNADLQLFDAVWKTIKNNDA